MDKKTLRKLYLEKRFSLNEATVEALNTAILHHIQQLEWQSIQTVHLFLPITKKCEIDTLRILEWLKVTHPTLKIVIPRADFATGTMEQVLYTPDLQLEENEYHITEPVGGEVIHPQSIDRVFVPLLCFDEQGYRLGYGKGFYDRFLQECRTDVEKIGLSFFEATPEPLPTEAHDSKLSSCITPEQIYRF